MGAIKEGEQSPMSPREIARRAFYDVKDQMKFSSVALVDETPELKALRKAAACCQKAVEEGGLQELREAQAHVKKAADRILATASAETDYENAQSRSAHRYVRTEAQLEAARTLENWRPGHLGGRSHRRQDDNGSSDQAQKNRLIYESSSGAKNGTQESAVQEERCSEKLALGEDATGPDTESNQADITERKQEADASVRDGDYLGGLRMYETLLEELPKEAVGSELHVALLLNSAFCCLKLSSGQTVWARAKQLLKRALDCCDEALRFDSSSAKAHFRRGCVFEALEKYIEAEEAYERALRYEPTDPRIRGGLARVARYLHFRLSPDKAAKAAAKEASQQHSHPKQSTQTKARLMKCCRCAEEVKGEGYFAIPCDHGPFCGQCKGWIEREGRGLPLCTACKQHAATTPRTLGIVERWEVGSELIKPRSIQEKQTNRAVVPERGKSRGSTAKVERDGGAKQRSIATMASPVFMTTAEVDEVADLSSMD